MISASSVAVRVLRTRAPCVTRLHKFSRRSSFISKKPSHIKGSSAGVSGARFGFFYRLYSVVFSVLGTSTAPMFVAAGCAFQVFYFRQLLLISCKR